MVNFIESLRCRLSLTYSVSLDRVVARVVCEEADELRQEGTRRSSWASSPALLRERSG